MGAHWIRVPFGYEIFVGIFKKAMDTFCPVERDNISEKIRVMEPWSGGMSTLCYQDIVSKLSELSTLPKILDGLISNTDTSREELERAKNKLDQSSNSIDKGTEFDAANAIQQFLVDGEIVVVSYKWRYKFSQGDVDAIVIGKLPNTNEDVLVICEAKNDMKTFADRACKQVIGNINQWMMMCDVDGEEREDLEKDKHFKRDYETLRVDNLKGRRVIPALAGRIFDQDTVNVVHKKLTKLQPMPTWIWVRANGMDATVQSMT